MNEPIPLNVCPETVGWADVLRVPAAFPDALSTHVARLHGAPITVEIVVETPRGPMHVRWRADHRHTFKVSPYFGRGRGEASIGDHLWFELYAGRFFAALRGVQ